MSSKYPNFLKPGDEIRIISPAGNIDPSLIDGAKSVLVNWGYRPTEGMFTRSVYGRFAGNENERYTDLQQALDDPNVKAILCSRGGYGLAQIIDKIDFSRFQEFPKWVIGFSDVTILHEALQQTGYISIHGGMAKLLTELPQNSQPLVLLENILKGKMPTYKVFANPNNRVGKAKGKLVGGNLSVFLGMRATPFEPPYAGSILFIEDVGEYPYKIDRMLQNLRLSGALSQLSGLIVGQFSDTEEDPNMNATIEEIIANAVKEYDYPVCFNFSAGHIDDNFPFLMGATVTLDVDRNGSEISFPSTFWKRAKDFFK
ncbi:MAG: LD-carboxypeptidase [Porphyromonadaceae bacterium]|nr:LD-carboxypeptidase [Porphyromonadaceae bacterium]